MSTVTFRWAKNCLTIVSYEEHVGDFLRLGRRNPQRICSGGCINAVYYKSVMERLLNRIRRVRPGMCESGDRFLFARQRTVPQRDNRQAVFGPTKSDCAQPPSVFVRFSTC